MEVGDAPTERDTWRAEGGRVAWRADRYLLQHAKRRVGGGVALALRWTTWSVALALAVLLLELGASFRQILQLLRSAGIRGTRVRYSTWGYEIKHMSNERHGVQESSSKQVTNAYIVANVFLA